MTPGPRQYIAVIQDPRGYPPPGADLDAAPPDGPHPPVLHSVIKVDDHQAAMADLREQIAREVEAMRSPTFGDDILNVGEVAARIRSGAPVSPVVPLTAAFREDPCAPGEHDRTSENGWNFCAICGHSLTPEGEDAIEEAQRSVLTRLREWIDGEAGPKGGDDPWSRGWDAAISGLVSILDDYERTTDGD